ncbi:MAG: LysR family transcriptional regulator [Gammaproteobacteria bacterium]|nr:LysR family transcriptional regulator [Gammaproteobacteria bacterium]
MLPNLRHLRLFTAISRHGRLVAAAQELHLTQPAATQAVHGLERWFGAELLRRSSGGVALTPAGELCRARSERALAQLHEGAGEALRAPDAGARLERALTAAQLQALVEVVEQGGFGRAARHGARSRPGLHRAVRSLERNAGLVLFEPTSYGLQPSREAGRLVRRARLAAAELEQARAEVSASAGGSSGRTVIGAMPLARTWLVPEAVLEFLAAEPRHAVSILDGPYETLLAALRGGMAEFLVGALRQPGPGADVVQEPLFDDPLAIVVRSGHPLAGRRRLRNRDLLRYPWVAPRPGSPLRRQFEALFAGPPAQRWPPIECNSLVAARALLLGSERMMLLSAHQVRHELRTGLLVALPHPQGRVTRPIGLARRRDWRPTAAQARLLECLRQRARSLAEGLPSATRAAIL